MHTHCLYRRAHSHTRTHIYSDRNSHTHSRTFVHTSSKGKHPRNLAYTIDTKHCAVSSTQTEENDTAKHRPTNTLDEMQNTSRVLSTICSWVCVQHLLTLVSNTHVHTNTHSRINPDDRFTHNNPSWVFSEPQTKTNIQCQFVERV